MTEVPATKLCSMCGKPISDDPQGGMVVQSDGSATGKVTYYCSERNPNPPTSAPSDDVVESVRQLVEVPGQHQARMLQYLPDFPFGAPLTVWKREVAEPAGGDEN